MRKPIPNNKPIYLKRNPNSNNISAAYAPLKVWSNTSIESCCIQKFNFSRRTAPKQWNLTLIKCCGDAKIELFAGAQHPDTTLTSWYDLNLALEMIMCPIQITILAV